jgi:hypothetical protein
MRPKLLQVYRSPCLLAMPAHNRAPVLQAAAVAAAAAAAAAVAAAVCCCLLPQLMLAPLLPLILTHYWR